MGGRTRRRRCEFCVELYRPDPRVGARQRACGREQCQQQRKRAAQAAWLADHADYFAGREAAHRRYRREVKTGLRAPRQRASRRAAASAPDLVPNFADQIEKDVISAQGTLPQCLRDTLPFRSEQDERSAYLLSLHGLIACLTPPPELPEQDELAARRAAWESLGRRAERRAETAPTPALSGTSEPQEARRVVRRERGRCVPGRLARSNA